MQRIEEFLEKYSYDGVIQSPQLASDLQYLVGRKLIDSENEGLYDILQSRIQCGCWKKEAT
jgi:CRISPR/Cas system CSM-associated protein Csm2 small subunit